MVRKIGIIAVLLVLGIVTSIWAMGGKPGPDKVADETVVAGNNEFALDLYAQLKAEKGNLFFSPYSISTALAITYVGSRGETEKQMANVLHFNPDQSVFHPTFAQVIYDLTGKKSKAYELNVANALWGQKDYKFLETFLDITKQHYGAGLKTVDFKNATEEVRQRINDWVEKQTKDKIKDLIKPGVLNPLTRLVLTNAIYFKGNWADQFDKKLTKAEPFTLTNGEKVDVPMMGYKGIQEFKYTKGDGFQALELPYVDNELAMTIFLPDEVDGINALEESLTAEKLSLWLKRMYQQEVIVNLPKFKLTCEFGLKDQLNAMGMTDAFILGKADFSGMTLARNADEKLHIGAVVHKAFVEVNEEGTEAAAATAVGMQAESIPEPPPVFRADHPFIFVIRDVRSGSILFMGRVMDPRG